MHITVRTPREDHALLPNEGDFVIYKKGTKRLQKKSNTQNVVQKKLTPRVIAENGSFKEIQYSGFSQSSHNEGSSARRHSDVRDFGLLRDDSSPVRTIQNKYYNLSELDLFNLEQQRYGMQPMYKGLKRRKSGLFYGEHAEFVKNLFMRESLLNKKYAVLLYYFLGKVADAESLPTSLRRSSIIFHNERWNIWRT